MTSSEQQGGEKRKLYRNPDKAKICGVCSGVAEFFGFEVWVVRIITVSLLLLGWPPIILAYFVLYFVLDPRPGSRKEGDPISRYKASKGSNQQQKDERPYKPSVKDVWRADSNPSNMLDDIERKFSKAESKLQRLESYVTSNSYELEKEFSKIN